MSREKHEVFKCDRCGDIKKPRERRHSEDDDGFPSGWAKVTFFDSSVNWKRDVCTDCANVIGQVIRRADVVVVPR